MSETAMTSRDITLTTSGAVSLPPQPKLAREMRSTLVIGGLLLLVFFVIGGGWAATAPLAGAAIASGVVSPDGKRKAVQHLEGGIIQDIRVKEGQTVKAGDPLVVLEDIGAKADVGALTSRLRALAAVEARLIAERTKASTIRFDHPSLADVDDADVRATLDQQRNQFETRLHNDRGREAILGQRVLQLEQQILGAERQLAGVRRQTELVRDEIVVVDQLVRAGFERRPRLLALQRTEAELMGSEGELVSRIARSQEAIGETRMQILALTTERIAEVDAQLSDTQAKRLELENQIRQSLDKLKRTMIIAPVDGVVLDVPFKTIGGVVKPGDKVLEIVPNTADLIIDARVSPNDIDDIHTGATARVVFPSYPQRYQTRIEGKVILVSGDAFEDQRSGAPFYLTKVRIDDDQMKLLAPGIELTPGMPAEVFIQTIERTLLDYLLDPLLQTIRRSFREH
jgi:HlyD family type I secretion membrane fusion protein